MTIAYMCILIAALLPYVWVGYAKFGTKGYDNDNPRDLLKLDSKAKRAHYAHLNAFEAFPAFAAAVIIAYLAGVPASTITNISVLFIICRILHGVFYILDKGKLRTLVWFCGFICILSLFILVLIS